VNGLEERKKDRVIKIIRMNKAPISLLFARLIRILSCNESLFAAI